MMKRIIPRTVGALLSACALFALSVPISSAQTEFTQNAKYVNVRSHGAKGDALSNDTAAIRAAVNAAKSGGKTVFFPAGVYRVSESIAVPAGVGLEGVTSACNGPWQNLYDGEAKNVLYRNKGSSNYFDPEMNPGTWILAANGSGNVDAGATFQLGGGNSVRRLGFLNMFSPPINGEGAVPTPPVIGADINKMTSAKGLEIEDISLTNPYFGIAVYQGSLKSYNTSAKLSGKGPGPVSISNVMGAAMYRGISVIGVKDKVTLGNIQFNYANYGSVYVKQHMNRCVDIDIAASANVTVTNVLSYGALTGLQTSAAFSGSPVNLTARNLNLEGERTLVMNASGTHQISNSYLFLTNKASESKNWAAVIIRQDAASAAKAVYNLTNIAFQDSIGDPSNPDFYVDASVQGGAQITLTNATMWNWSPSTNTPMIKFNHASGGASKFTVANLGLCSSRSGQLAAVSGDAYQPGELAFVGGRFPASVLGNVDTRIKFTNCTKADGGNTLFSN